MAEQRATVEPRGRYRARAAGVEGVDAQGGQTLGLLGQRRGKPGDVADPRAGRDEHIAEAGRVGVVDLGELEEEVAPAGEGRGVVVDGGLPTEGHLVEGHVLDGEERPGAGRLRELAHALPQVGDDVTDVMDGRKRHDWEKCRRVAKLYAIISALVSLRFDHVGLSVADLDAAIAFYAAAFEYAAEFAFRLEVIDTRGAMLVHPSGHRLELFERPAAVAGLQGLPPLEALGTHGYGHFALNASEIDAPFERALAAGARVVLAPGPSPEPGVRFAFLGDPEGNLIELVERA